MSLLRRNKAPEILMHHRFPTSTANRRNACHPFSTKNYFENQYVLVHNGVLWNEDELKKEHDKLGIQYVSMQSNGKFNDSEALAYDVARYLEGDVDKITAEGTIAFICIKRDKDGEPVSLHFGRNTGNPLMFKHTKKTITISSEGDGELVIPDRVYNFEYATGELTYTDCVIPTGYTPRKPYSGNYQGYGGGYDWDDDGYEPFDSAYNYDQFGNYIPPVYREPDLPKASTASFFLGDGTDIKDFDKSNVKHFKQAMMSEAYEDVYFAIELGEEMLTAKENRERELQIIVDADVDVSEDDMDEYCDIRDTIYYITQALAELRQEVHGQRQMGFHIHADTPASDIK